LSDPSELFYGTERNGRTVPEAATLTIETDDWLIRLTATISVNQNEQTYEYTVCRRKAIRDENDDPYRTEASIDLQVEQSVRALAYACIDALPLPKRHQSRPFTARG
jgi:hypothetical protein